MHMLPCLNNILLNILSLSLHCSIPSSPRHDMFFVFSEESMAVAANQYLFPVMLLGEDATDFTTIEMRVVEDLWTQFRFQEGFAPRSVRHPDTFDFVAFNAARQAWQEENIIIAATAFADGKDIAKREAEEGESSGTGTTSTSSDVKASTA